MEFGDYMSHRKTLVVTALASVVAGLLVTTPAEAAGHSANLKSKTIAISTAGNGKVAIQCASKKTCKGYLQFVGAAKKTSFSVPAGRTTYEKVALNDNASANPHTHGTDVGDVKRVTGAKLQFRQSAPAKRTYTYTVNTETALTRQDITGTITNTGSVTITDLHVDLVKEVRGGNVTVVKGADVSVGGTYRFGVNLGANNSPSAPYKLRIRGRDQNGVGRSWYWRGSDGAPVGGGAYLRDGSPVRAGRLHDFVADFTYTSISGTTASGAEVTVAATPPSFRGGSAVSRELDIPYCANVFGQDDAEGGSYAVGFLPVTPADSPSVSNRYMIGAKSGSVHAWYGKSATRFGSCYDATNYERSRAALIKLETQVVGKALGVSATNNDIKINGVFSPAYKPTAQGDRYITLREKIPGVKILDTPIVARGLASSSGDRTFTALEPGKYWVELGRRTGCADWYPSKFPNNNLYFKGLDRASEKWKAFRRLRDLSGNANSGYEYIARHADPNPASGTEQNKIKSGYQGWMYREYCKAMGAGVITTLNVDGTSNSFTKTTPRNPIGAVVKGKVKRSGSKTNKEMMVRLTSPAGTRVVRADVTDSSGTFYVAGLASGKWTISVNPDSWRGIDRTFTGRHSITVKAGKGYNVGTLRLKG